NMDHPARRQSIATRSVALAVVVLDVSYHSRPILPLVGVVAILCLNDRALPSLGMKWGPTQGWADWFPMAACFEVAIGVVVLLFGGICILSGKEMTIYRTAPRDLAPQLFVMGVYAPVAEEVVCRSLLATAVFPTVGHTGTIVVSGLTFALIHVLGG